MSKPDVIWKCPKCRIKIGAVPGASVMHWCRSQGGKYIAMEKQEVEAPA